MAQPKIINPNTGWVPGTPLTESSIHVLDPRNPTQWNQLLRATTNVKVNGYSVCTITISVDVSHYRARYTHEMLFPAHSVFNSGHIYSSSIGPLVFEIAEI
jgi:hypothetical protein